MIFRRNKNKIRKTVDEIDAEKKKGFLAVL